MQINNEITLAELSFPSQFVVWAARQWIRIRDPGEPDAQRLCDAFQTQPVDPVQCECGVIANQIMRDWVEPSHQLPLQARLAELAMQLGAAGLWVRCQSADRPRYPIASLH